MKTTPTVSSLRIVLAGFCLATAAFLATSAVAADSTAQPRADQATPALPLSHTFEKVTDGGGTPFVLKVKNDSKATLQLRGHVLLSVVNHATDKARKLSDRSLDAGQTWAITELTADDKVVLSAAGYAPLEIRVPFKL